MNKVEIIDTTQSTDLSAEQVEQATAFYETARENDSAIYLGIGPDEVRESAGDAATLMATYRVEEDGGEQTDVHAPLLVPLRHLEWYNLPYLEERYGPDTPLYCYVHPPMPEDGSSKSKAAHAIKSVLNEGGVIILDQYKDQAVFDDENWEFGTDPENDAISLHRDGEITYQLESITSLGKQRKTDVYAGVIDYKEDNHVEETVSPYEAYQKAIDAGDIVVDPENGPAMEARLSDEECERVWELYQRPFERLTRENPVLAGFDKESLVAQLKDPAVVKLINRVDGKISTLAVYSHDFSKYPWFNADFYQKSYPEIFENNNIILMPGIVTDDEMRGQSYTPLLIDLMTKAYKNRTNQALVTFECTEISTRYIPRIVRLSLANTGLVTFDEGFDKPMEIIEFKALSKLPDGAL